MRFLGRLGFLVFMLLGGIILYPFKWLLMGTRASRDRKRLIELQEQQLRTSVRTPGDPPFWPPPP